MGNVGVAAWCVFVLVTRLHGADLTIFLRSTTKACTSLSTTHEGRVYLLLVVKASGRIRTLFSLSLSSKLSADV